MSDAAVDTSSEITTKDLKEKKKMVEEAENGKDAPANGNANEVKMGKRPKPVKSELDEEEEQRKRHSEKNKAAAARKKERKESLQRESERLELRNAELKTQIRELEQERQQLILMLTRRRPTCIVRTDSVSGCAAGHRGLPLGPNINGCGASY
ncbi:jun dimerization protein 2-like [Lepus europaeus]|uniref:jun dimerization protein 2-like n=1 Tax=Lepus europaeus TaxID=9983 RepID=UPI002B46146C|nr:jun dimerization protein 2-like [Lepus europaeus]